MEPQLVNGVWHKAAISAKNAARLRREALLSGQCVFMHMWHAAQPCIYGPLTVACR